MMAAGLTQPAVARATFAFDIPASRLSDAVIALGTQAGISIGLSSALATAARTRPIKGRMALDKALRRLLAGTRLVAIRIDERTYLITGVPPVSARRPDPTPVPGPVATPANDIVVTASKRDTRLGDFPGTVSLLDAHALRLDRDARTHTQAIVDAIPALASTQLGPGRNKLIIRGIADSSFTGPTQAIVGQYLGDVRLNYDAPDPDLNLYDMAKVEVLEGPQGTLYGAGSLGGIVRLVPNAPDMQAVSGSAAAGLGAVAHGGANSDLAGMINLPLRRDIIAARGVFYRSIDGGYIRDAQRGLERVNRTTTTGGRISLRYEPGDGWRVDIGATFQDLNSADAQYAEHDQPPYTRRSAIEQPFDNDYQLGQLTLSKDWGDLKLLSATGIVRHDVTERFDATGSAAGAPVRVFDQNSHITLFSNETRLSRQGRGGPSWLIGTTIISNGESLIRDLGDVGAPARIAGVHNAVTQGAIYGEATIHLSQVLSVTGGGRLAYSRLIGELLDAGKKAGEPSRTEVEVLPSIAIAWRSGSGVTAYVRYQEGFRPGGLSVSATGGGVASQRYHGDSIATYEAGARFGDAARDRLTGSFTLSYAHWENIQADLVDDRGLPLTANLGNGRIVGLEIRANWRASSALGFEAGLFLNDSELISAAPGFEKALHAELPDVAKRGGRLALSYRRTLTGDWSLTANGSVRYFGHSRLGVGPQLDIAQGNYADTSLNARIGRERFGVSLGVGNILDSRRNRFSLGNPFGVMNREQITPQTPRTVRIGFDAKF